jgi:hypothetical protein
VWEVAATRCYGRTPECRDVRRGAAPLAFAPEPANAGFVGCMVGAPSVAPVATGNCVLDIGYCVGLYDPFLRGTTPARRR